MLIPDAFYRDAEPTARLRVMAAWRRRQWEAPK